MLLVLDQTKTVRDITAMLETVGEIITMLQAVGEMKIPITESASQIL